MSGKRQGKRFTPVPGRTYGNKLVLGHAYGRFWNVRCLVCGNDTKMLDWSTTDNTPKHCQKCRVNTMPAWGGPK